MKKIIFLGIIALFPSLFFCQILLETIDGNEITLNPNRLNNNVILGNLNTSEESIQFKSLFKFNNSEGVMPDKYLTIGIKGKPSDGIVTIFSNGNFNKSTNLNVSFTKLNFLLPKDSKEIDFITLKLDYNINEYVLFNPDTLFTKQINKFNFESLGISFNYNLLISGKNLVNFSMGFLQKNNYSKLKPYEIVDSQNVTDPETGTIRYFEKKINGKIGNYNEFDSFPIRFGYTLCPSENENELEKLKFGYSIYYSSEFGKFKPIHNLGSILYLTKQSEKTGIRFPILGIGMQLEDLTDNLNKNNSITKRISFNLSTTFNITTL